MLAQPSSGPRGGNEDSARQMLDTVASVAADPKGYKARLAQLDAATAKSLEAETKARAEQRKLQDLLDATRAERQALDNAVKNFAAEKDAALDEIRKARMKHDAIVETERNTIKREAEVLAQRTAEVDKLKTELNARVEAATKAGADYAAQKELYSLKGGELDERIKAATAREAAAAETIAKLRAALPK